MALTTTDTVATRAPQRTIGTPLPLGMAGLTIASFLTSGLDLHWISSAQTLAVGVILAAIPFTLQLIASVLSFLRGDAAGATTLGVLAATWLGLGLVEIVAASGQASQSVGLLLLASGALVALSATAVLTTRRVPGLLFLTAAVRFELAGIHYLTGSSPWQHASGIVGLVVTAVAASCATAFELESQNPGS